MKPSIEIQISGTNKSYSPGITPAEIIRDVPVDSHDEILAADLNGKIVDLAAPLTESGKLDFVSIKSPRGTEILRHSAAHVMAQAVKELFPNVKVAIGPAIEDGFYYDFDTSRPFTPEDLEKIEGRMREIIKSRLPFRRMLMMKEEAVQYFRQKGESYKVELIDGIDSKEVSLYSQGEFTDLCRGPHIPHSGFIKAFKLMKVAGAYWRGDERNAMLQRIYGTAFPSKEDLKNHLYVIEEAKKRDHRKLGKELDLFSISEEAGPGLVIWHPKGAMLRYLVEEFERTEHLKRGYQMVVGPQLLKRELWEKSGHFDHYRDNMYFTRVDEVDYGIKPMNCLSHMLIYKSKIRSYRDLPLRYFELGTVHRHEKSGVLHGLMRVRQFTQDDAHILCTPKQLNDEILGIINFVREVMGIFGFEYTIELSTRPDKSIGSDEDWERATESLEKALKYHGAHYEVNEGDGAFYGPKIDIKLKDALSRLWQCATIQCDFTLPERFGLHYVDSDGGRKRPVMIHRVVLGAIERFLGVLVEHYGGAFPLWLAPVQVIIMTITDRQNSYAHEVAGMLRENGLRVDEDIRNEKIGLKIREARNQKIPYMVILGDKEANCHTLSVRKRGEDRTEELSLERLLSVLRDKIVTRSNVN
ncbi:MAG: threonine--tRNA ligase [Deltaproteobacteria bacterium]|nr:threonine--tRNA ligase [Deltaproteobacteria bacterium]